MRLRLDQIIQASQSSAFTGHRRRIQGPHQQPLNFLSVALHELPAALRLVGANFLQDPVSLLLFLIVLDIRQVLDALLVEDVDVFGALVRYQDADQI